MPGPSDFSDLCCKNINVRRLIALASQLKRVLFLFPLTQPWRAVSKRASRLFSECDVVD